MPNHHLSPTRQNAQIFVLCSCFTLTIVWIALAALLPSY